MIHNGCGLLAKTPDGTFSVSLTGDAAKVDTPTKSVTGGSFIAHGLNVRASKDAVYGCSWWEALVVLPAKQQNRFWT